MFHCGVLFVCSSHYFLWVEKQWHCTIQAYLAWHGIISNCKYLFSKCNRNIIYEYLHMFFRMLWCLWRLTANTSFTCPTFSSPEKKHLRVDYVKKQTCTTYCILFSHFFILTFVLQTKIEKTYNMLAYQGFYNDYYST